MKPDKFERLAKLNDLRTSGALTDEEFEAEKRKLLSAQSPGRLIYAGICVLAVMAVVLLCTWHWQSGKQEQVKGPANQRPKLSAAQPVPATTGRIPMERLAAAFEAATGHRRAFTQTVKQERFTVTPIKIVPLPFGPALLVRREIKDGCHACVGYLGVYYLQEKGDAITVLASYPEAVSGWGWGAAPTDWQLTERFTANPAIYASGGFTGQGVTQSSASITELTSRGPINSDLIGTGFSNAGAITEDYPRPACELNGKIVNVVKDRSFDVVVSGTVRGRDRYAKRDGKFVAVNSRDWGIPCPSQ